MSLSYVAQLGFIKAGRAYLWRAWQAAGIEADVKVLIEEYDPNTFVWEIFYQGRVDFTAAEFTATEARCNVENEGFIQKFLNRDDVQVDLFASQSVSGATGPAAQQTTVELHSRAIEKRYEAAIGEEKLVLPPSLMFNNDSYAQLIYLGFGGAKANEFGVQEVGGGGVAALGGTPTYSIPAGVEGRYDQAPYFAVPIYETKEEGEFNINLNVNASIEVSRLAGDFDALVLGFFFRVNNEAPQRLFFDYGGQDSQIGGTYKKLVRFTYTVSRHLALGDKLFIYGVCETLSIGNPVIGDAQFQFLMTMLPGSALTFSASTQTRPTPAVGLLAYEALARTAQALTDEVDCFRSDFFGRPDCRFPTPLDGPGALLLVTGGFQVRGFPLAEKSLFATWRGLYDSLSAIYNLGYGGESDGTRSWLRVEEMAYWYPPDVVLDLTAQGPVAGLRRKVLQNRHYQTVEAGYEQWQAEQANGLTEFNAKRQWTTPLTQVKNSYPALSKYLTAGLRLETIRRQRYDVSQTKDDRSDNDNFLICLLRKDASTAGSGYETERNQRALTLEGIPSPATVYNLRLSPARLLRRHGAALRAGLEPAAADNLVRFAFGEGNTGLVAQLAGEPAPVAEGAAVPVHELAAPLWQPLSFTFTAPLRRGGLRALLRRPTGRVRFLDERGQAQEGWVLDFKHQAADQQADFTLLACTSLSTP